MGVEQPLANAWAVLLKVVVSEPFGNVARIKAHARPKAKMWYSLLRYPRVNGLRAESEVLSEMVGCQCPDMRFNCVYDIHTD
jgi:hypothetical protein